MRDFQFTPQNQVAFERWSQLDLTGRRRGFGQEFLNESSIDANLRRYGDNQPAIYEKVLRIEKEVFEYRAEKEKNKQTAEDNRRRVQQRSSRPARKK